MKTFVRGRGRRRVLAALTLWSLLVVALLYFKFWKQVASEPKSTFAKLDRFQTPSIDKTRGGAGRDHFQSPPSDRARWGDGNGLTDAYCNSPFKTKTGAEGILPEGSKLRQVHVFVRHGARTPLNHPSNFQSHRHFDCDFKTWSQRHGVSDKFSRYADELNKSYETLQSFDLYEDIGPYKAKNVCEDAMLTCLGSLQHLTLGHFLAERYASNSHLFERRLSLHSQVHVRSTESVRAFQSAMALVYGFLPNFELSEIEFSKAENDCMCVPGAITCTCDINDDLRNKYTKYVKATRSFSDRYRQTRAHIDRVIAVKGDKSLGPKQVMDFLLTQYCHDNELPCSKSSPHNCIDANHIDDLWKQFGHAENITVNDPDRNALKHSSLHLYPVFVEIVSRLQDFIAGTSKRSFILYSGHDKTLRALLRVFGLYDGLWPSFAARIVVEVYERVSATENAQIKHSNAQIKHSFVSTDERVFYLRVLYNGNDVTNDVIFCPDSKTQTMCEFESFTKFVNSYLGQLFKVSNYRSICNA